MAKRFTDTDKWKKPFFRGLDAPYKALWLYLLDDCDMAGIWIVDFEIAKIRIGGGITEDGAVEKFGDHIQVFDSGRKWLIRDFTDFQYGALKETNRMHLAVIQLLERHNIGASKPLPRGQGHGQGKGQGTRQGQGVAENLKFALDEIYLGAQRFKWAKIVDFDFEINSFREKVIGSEEDYRNHDTNGLRKAFQYQLRNAKTIRNGNKQTNHIRGLAEDFAKRHGSDAPEKGL